VAALIEIKDLSKNYNGALAINHLSLSVYPGEIFGFIGPNGAGKTSTIRILATLLRPTSGDALIASHSVLNDPYAVRSLIGYMPDFFGIYGDLTVEEYLDFFAGCFQIFGTRRQTLITELLELVELTHRANDPVENLSRGMKQRLSLARTLIHDPSVLILDEPASGLDPRARVEIRELLRELSRMGKTIFFSSHILSDVAEICTRIGIIEAGELVVSGTPDELQYHQLPSRRIRIGILGDPDEAAEIIGDTSSILDIHIDKKPVPPHVLEIDFVGTLEDLADLLTKLAGRCQVVQFSEVESSLEEVYLRATRGQVS
jgi:ABC-2 type transport system ATP-binding protein